MPDDPTPTPPRPAPPWRVKFDGVCSRCGAALLKGDIAIYERSTRTIRCVACPGEFQAQAHEPKFDPGVAGGSARREFERRKANRETQIRGFGRLGGAVLALAVANAIRAAILGLDPRPEQVHLFYFGPASGAVFIGHALNGLAREVRLYEEDLGRYLPSITLP